METLENEEQVKKKIDAEEIFISVFLNLFILAVVFGVTLLVNEQHPLWLTEEFIFGMIIYPILILGLGGVLTVLVGASRKFKNMLGLMPAFVISVLFMFVVLIYGTDLVRWYAQHEKNVQAAEYAQEEAKLARLHIDAPLLDEWDVRSKLPTDQEYELRDLQVFPDQQYKFWVRASTKSWSKEKNYIGYYDLRKYQLSQLKSLDDLWNDVKKQQSISGENAAEVGWNLKNSQVTFTEKGGTNSYLVTLKPDDFHVAIDHVDVIHK